jgi:hypothetical protein
MPCEMHTLVLDDRDVENSRGLTLSDVANKFKTAKSAFLALDLMKRSKMAPLYLKLFYKEFSNTLIVCILLNLSLLSRDISSQRHHQMSSNINLRFLRHLKAIIMAS